MSTSVYLVPVDGVLFRDRDARGQQEVQECKGVARVKEQEALRCLKGEVIDVSILGLLRDMSGGGGLLCKDWL